MSSYCDGVADCEDNQDEIFDDCCSSDFEYYTDQFCCEEVGRHFCDGKCLPEDLFCDGTPNCGDKSDEVLEACCADDVDFAFYDKKTCCELAGKFFCNKSEECIESS